MSLRIWADGGHRIPASVSVALLSRISKEIQTKDLTKTISVRCALHRERYGKSNYDYTGEIKRWN
jgi:hypothetical protein